MKDFLAARVIELVAVLIGALVISVLALMVSVAAGVTIWIWKAVL